ncbi:MAG: T9SS type A sorting domain-containing protein [Candidatus Cloacimonetes bacterium]|nr:T9SS type A sorting domain-containing protein [Candidatus Cloacimonadota bacterium]
MKTNSRMFLSVTIIAFCIMMPLYGEQNLPSLYDNDSFSKGNSKFDYSSLTWIESFDSLQACLSLRYAFTQWKAIDWEEKVIETRPKIIEAQDTQDNVKFIQTLFEYLNDVPDGHISLIGDVDPFKQDKLAGCYGFNIMPISDGRIVATLVLEGSPAYENGLRTGDRIISWNGVDVHAVSQRELWNYFRNYATLEGRLLSRYTMLSRDAIGTQATITYQNHETDSEETMTLDAYEDDFELFTAAVLNTASLSYIETYVEYHILQSGNGYLRIGAEDSDAMTPEEIMESEIFIEVVEAIDYFNANDVNNLIIDLRFNMGGNDLMAAVMMGLFYDEASFYEYITGPFEMDYAIMFTLWTTPITPRYDGNVVALIDPNCISTGEGLAMMIKRLEKGRIVSSWGTNGSFGMVDYDPIFLPEGLILIFPQARSLNENQVIQLDSDSTLTGGVVPDIRIPLTVENVIAQWNQDRDVQLEYADSILTEEHCSQSAVLLYPNPCSENLKIKILREFETSCDISFYDIRGRFIHEQRINFGALGEAIHLDTHIFSSGIYFYHISDRTNEYVGKILHIE